MVDAVTLGALNRIIRNNPLTFQSITVTGSAAIVAPKFLSSILETATSSAVTLQNGGVSQIGTTNAATTYVLSAPQVGVNKFIFENVTSTADQVVFTGSSLITFITPLNPTAASSITRIHWSSSLAAGGSVELQGISATQWAVMGNNSTAITFTT